MAKYTKTCPKCNTEMNYTRHNALKKSIEKNLLCAKCKYGTDKIFVNLCKKCGKESEYYTLKSYKNAIDRYGCKYCYKTGKKQPEHIAEKSRSSLKKFGNKKFPYEIWLEKYGKDIADQKLAELKEKHSKNNSGSGNPMYGRPAPQGSGNGWSGWYNGWRFRSLLELSYMVNVIEKGNLKWTSAESKEYAIPYEDFYGNKRNYFPDFIINGSDIIEVKPKNLQNSVEANLKKDAAEIWCSKRGYTYAIVDCDKLTDEELIDLYTSGKLVFIDRYQKKFEEKYLNVK